MRDRAPLPTWFCPAFRYARAVAFGGLLATGALLIGVPVLGRVTSVDIGWGIALLTFATLEYVNYYHVQLKHDSFADWRYLNRHRQLREAPLRTDLRRACGSASAPGATARPS